ncbi:CPBP family intramembrane metalloprotease [Oscillatoriales cyanobacterium LEGE 11467]|uniref:CPBP family intramembrane metalloprotease n=1 Tax=Zarconia navalis LEGE 11467 TaxID=1828826 RepID=A0A928W2G5_9CYAN|nr:CPBP family glutamic-type intramembrane protease [Zarconia navalis]MBE9042718.1 CPBP family intramembrane metalloprotease [Zarconia navalis LEGE 11467]
MTFKQAILTALTIVTTALIGLSLLGSWQKPQIQGQLELSQINLVLQAAEWQPDEPELVELRDRLFGEEVFEEALTQYQNSQEVVTTNLTDLRDRLDTLTLREVPATVAETQELKTNLDRLTALEDTLDLRLGLLQARQTQIQEARSSWKAALDRSENLPNSSKTGEVARILVALWDDPPQVPVDAERQLQTSLTGWFRNRALEQLYQVQGRSDAFVRLIAREQQRAESAVYKLVLINGVSIVGLVVGLGLLVFLLWQRFAKGKDSILVLDDRAKWSVPWNWEIVAQVVVLGFFITFFLGQTIAISVILPLAIKLFDLSASLSAVRLQAISILASYALAAAAGLLVMYLSLAPFRPLPEDWFKFKLGGKDFLWGLGGYFAAVPLVIGISLLNQQIWKGQGGSNPILEIALQGQDWVAIACFFLTASIAAPLFEEFIFRGFLLPALTNYLPVWGAVVASSLVFAMAHLSLSEVLPLATLGIVLGTVYARSRNLLAPILLHSLWNGSTLLSLFVLGSSN